MQLSCKFIVLVAIISFTFAQFDGSINGGFGFGVNVGFGLSGGGLQICFQKFQLNYFNCLSSASGNAGGIIPLLTGQKTKKKSSKKSTSQQQSTSGGSSSSSSGGSSGNCCCRRRRCCQQTQCCRG